MSSTDPDPWASPGPGNPAQGAPGTASGPPPVGTAPAGEAVAGDPWVPVWASTGGGPGGPPPSRRRRWPVVVAVVVASAVLVVGVVALAVTGVRSGWDSFASGVLGVEEGDAYGDNPTLDALWDACEAGDAWECDELYGTSGIGTEYEDFGWTCGERVPEGVGMEYCVDVMDDVSDAESVREGSRYGDDAALDALWDDCEGGDGVACDELYASAEEGSDYQDFGVTCGDRYSTLRAPDFCADALR